jgi:uracil-DNA glycosylase
MDTPAPDPRRLLAALQRELEDLERSGVRWLNVAPRPDLAAAVPSAPALSAPVSPGPAAPGPAQALPAGAAAELRAVSPSAAPPQPGELPLAASGPSSEGLPHPSMLETLAALRETYRDCRNCKLCSARRSLVFGVGSEHPRLLFIGEGPGADEDAQGEPFVGRAGQLLTGLIRALGLVRDDVYITNVVKCRPPGNRNPEPDEVASCRPILQRQIELLDPRLIVCLGNVPLKVLKPAAAGITRERGTPFTYQRWEVLPTFHPSYLLRNPAAIETCWQDFRKALRMAYPQP